MQPRLEDSPDFYNLPLLYTHRGNLGLVIRTKMFPQRRDIRLRLRPLAEQIVRQQMVSVAQHEDSESEWLLLLQEKGMIYDIF